MLPNKESLAHLSNAVSSESFAHPRMTKGAQIGNNIYVSDGVGIVVLLTYCHEVGHFIADQLSFRGKKVLTPDEAKEETLIAWPDYWYAKQLYGKMVYEGTENAPAHQVTVPTANNLLRIFTRGWFDAKMINFHPVPSAQDIEQLINEGQKAGKILSSGIKVNVDGELIYSESREGRNAEVPAVAVEYGCLHILTNSMRPYHPFFLEQFVKTSNNPAERKAQSIAMRAYQGENWVLPSTKDLLDTVNIKHLARRPLGA